MKIIEPGATASPLVPVAPLTLTLENPTSSEDITLAWFDGSDTITKIRAVLRGTTPSVTWTLRHGTDRSATGTEVVTGGTTTTNTTTGQQITTFDFPNIPSGNYLWFETTAKTGTVDALSITIYL